ncbi:MAG: polysaccharide deacetylase family protein, partial [Flavobacteriales bacterium]|nr:polysaccharide deacetylase family protein [Flavobacteriales bacterium]
MNAFSVDLEDWYQGIELPFDSWNKHEERIRKGLDPLLELLDKHSTKATFFTLGWIGEKYPELIKQIANSGHEMASHGYSHDKVYDLT